MTASVSEAEVEQPGAVPSAGHVTSSPEMSCGDTQRHTSLLPSDGADRAQNITLRHEASEAAVRHEPAERQASSMTAAQARMPDLQPSTEPSDSTEHFDDHDGVGPQLHGHCSFTCCLVVRFALAAALGSHGLRPDVAVAVIGEEVAPAQPPATAYMAAVYTPTKPAPSVASASPEVPSPGGAARLLVQCMSLRP